MTLYISLIARVKSIKIVDVKKAQFVASLLNICNVIFQICQTVIRFDAVVIKINQNKAL